MQAEPDRDDALAADTARRELHKGLLIVGVHLSAVGIALGVALWIGEGRRMPPPPSTAAAQAAPLAASPGAPGDSGPGHTIGGNTQDGVPSSQAASTAYAEAPADAGRQAGLPARVELPAPWFVDADGRIHARDR